MRQSSRKPFFVNLICTMSILGAFAVAALVLANVGVRVYKNIVSENNSNYRLRTSLSYVATKVRQMDEEGGIYIEKRGGLDVLVMEQVYEGELYETLIYYYDHKVYEVFHKAEEELVLQEVSDSCEIMEIRYFSMEEQNPGLLHFTAKDNNGKEESMVLSLRTER